MELGVLLSELKVSKKCRLGPVQSICKGKLTVLSAVVGQSLQYSHSYKNYDPAFLN